jgi:hypothetical protein
MYNYFRQGWIVARLHAMLEQTFGPGNPLVFNLPARSVVKPDDVLFNEFTMMLAGDTAPLKEAFQRTSRYWLPADRTSDLATPNGFEMADPSPRNQWVAAQTEQPGKFARDDGWMQFSPTTVVKPDQALRLPTDAWPFLYLRGPMIPALSLRGMLVMGVAGAVLLLPFLRRATTSAVVEHSQKSDARFLSLMFFLGAGFMLIETKAVVQMALLFGSTWIVNSIVFCAVLTMILIANLFVLAVRPSSLVPYYVGLFVALAASAIVPLDAFLGMSREVQIAGSCLLAFAPVMFAGVIFATSFSNAADADRAFGANVAGAMVGGLSEYSSMLLGFQYVVLVALAFYAVSAFSAIRRPESSAPALV